MARSRHDTGLSASPPGFPRRPAACRRASCAAEQIGDVRRPGADHLYWPALDVDLSVASLRDPQAFPMVART
ncbi:DUF2442 domain-containing protein [Duganella radicis]|uniref:DUF2442 domain-containing protein n=1 Tax=Duganella radicis TaxID=551988 RepID=UPI003530746D